MSLTSRDPIAEIVQTIGKNIQQVILIRTQEISEIIKSLNRASELTYFEHFQDVVSIIVEEFPKSPTAWNSYLDTLDELGYAEFEQIVRRIIKYTFDYLEGGVTLDSIMSNRVAKESEIYGYTIQKVSQIAQTLFWEFASRESAWQSQPMIGESVGSNKLYEMSRIATAATTRFTYDRKYKTGDELLTAFIAAFGILFIYIHTGDFRIMSRIESGSND